MRKKQKYTIATLGSHSALQILKGAKDEGFKTLLVTTEDRADFYSSFVFINDVRIIKSFKEFPIFEKKLKTKHIILIPHGSFVAYLGVEGNKKISIPYFGNKQVLDWEADRSKQREWLKESDINIPHEFRSADEIHTYPVIVKSYGAAGGKGYFYARNKQDFLKKMKKFVSRRFVIQEYIIGVTMFFHYFYSPLTKKIELMSIDRRYETNVDSLGRIPLLGQKDLHINPSYVVVGNAPLTIRESLLPKVYMMGQRIVDTSKNLINKKGLYGPFCLETVITPDQNIYAIEISCRIVAGTNLFIEGSPYTWLTYDEPMSTGKRIAREIKMAITKKKLNILLD